MQHSALSCTIGREISENRQLARNRRFADNRNNRHRPWGKARFLWAALQAVRCFGKADKGRFHMPARRRQGSLLPAYLNIGRLLDANYASARTESAAGPGVNAP